MNVTPFGDYLLPYLLSLAERLTLLVTEGSLPAWKRDSRRSCSAETRGTPPLGKFFTCGSSIGKTRRSDDLILIFYTGIFSNRVRELYIGVQIRLMTSKSFYKVFFRVVVHLKKMA